MMMDLVTRSTQNIGAHNKRARYEHRFLAVLSCIHVFFFYELTLLRYFTINEVDTGKQKYK